MKMCLNILSMVLEGLFFYEMYDSLIHRFVQGICDYCVADSVLETKNLEISRAKIWTHELCTHCNPNQGKTQADAGEVTWMQ